MNEKLKREFKNKIRRLRNAKGPVSAIVCRGECLGFIDALLAVGTISDYHHACFRVGISHCYNIVCDAHPKWLL